MPTWEQVICYKCGDCGRVYQVLPSNCVCAFAVMAKGDKQGSFIVTDISMSNNIVAMCILCGCTNKFTLGALKRQKSCGCVPKHVELLEVTRALVKYKCNNCNKEHIVVPPIVVYCCEGDFYED